MLFSQFLISNSIIIEQQILLRSRAFSAHTVYLHHRSAVVSQRWAKASLPILYYSVPDHVFVENVDLIATSLGWSALWPFSPIPSSSGDTCIRHLVGVEASYQQFIVQLYQWHVCIILTLHVLFVFEFPRFALTKLTNNILRMNNYIVPDS